MKVKMARNETGVSSKAAELIESEHTKATSSERTGGGSSVVSPFLLGKAQKRDSEKEGAARLPVNNFLLIKHCIDDPSVEFGLQLVGTFVQTVLFPPYLSPIPDFHFDYRFADETATVGGDYLHLRRPEPVFSKSHDGADWNGTRSTFETKIPLIIDSVLEAFPFSILTATADIELSSTFEDSLKLRLRPDLVLSKWDRRGNFALQDLKVRKSTLEKYEGMPAGDPSLVRAILDKIDRTKHYDFVSPYPEVRYEYDDTKKKYCARYTLKYYVIKGGFTKFMTIILPIFMICAMNTINVLNDAFDFGDGPVNVEDHIGVSSALGLTAVFLLPSIIELNTRQQLYTQDNLYILFIFISLFMSSIPRNFAGSNAPELFGMTLFWFSFISPIINAIKYYAFVRKIQSKANRIAERKGMNPFLKIGKYEQWKSGKKPFEEAFSTVGDVVEMSEQERVKYGYKKEENFGKFQVISYS